MQYPGRENRIREQPVRRLEQLVDRLATSIEPLLDRPYAFFGHSLGALVAYELASRLTEAPGLAEALRRLWLSARRPPHLPSARPLTIGLSDSAFIEHLRELGGTPAEVLAHQELMDLLLPILRADFEMLETYQLPVREPLACPITALGGESDPNVEAVHLEQWSRYCRSGFSVQLFPGGHFYLAEQEEALCRVVASGF